MKLSEKIDLQIKDAMKKDDLLSLEKNLPSEKILKIREEVNSRIDTAIDFAERCEFPNEKELYDNIYG